MSFVLYDFKKFGYSRNSTNELKKLVSLRIVYIRFETSGDYDLSIIFKCILVMCTYTATTCYCLYKTPSKLTKKSLSYHLYFVFLYVRYTIDTARIKKNKRKQ